MIGILVGSLRQRSYNRSLAQEISSLIDDDVKFIKWDDLPLYNEDLEAATPDSVVRIRQEIKAVDGVIIVTPEYNGSIPGGLKNALDWLSRPVEDNALRGKPALVFGSSTGMFGAVWAQAEVKKALGIIGARLLDEEEIPFGQAFDGKVFLEDEAIQDIVKKRIEWLLSNGYKLESQELYAQQSNP